jgi:hypothetical protein
VHTTHGRHAHDINDLLGVERVLALHELIDGSLQCFAERERESAS